MSLVPIVDEYLITLRAMGRRPTTLDHKRYTLGQFTAWRTSDTEVTKLEARQYLHHLTDTYTPGGVSSRLKVLRTFFNWCVAEELIEANPFKGLTVIVPDEVRTTATDDQVEAMLTRAAKSRHPKRDIALLTLLADTGARKMEIAALELADFDLTSGVVHIRVSKTKPRIVPLTDRAIVSMQRWLRQRGTASGSVWNVSDPYSLVKALVKRHSQGELTPHTMRRRFAVDWQLRGGSESSLMRICGWSTTEMVRHYSKASADVIAAEEFKRLMG